MVARDLIRDYELEEDQLAMVRGRLHVGPTARRMLQGALRLSCEFDDYSADAPINRYLKAACGAVVRAPVLSSKLRRRAMRVRAYMTDVGELQLGDRRAILIDRPYRALSRLGSPGRPCARRAGRDLAGWCFARGCLSHPYPVAHAARNAGGTQRSPWTAHAGAPREDRARAASRNGSTLIWYSGSEKRSPT